MFKPHVDRLLARCATGSRRWPVRVAGDRHGRGRVPAVPRHLAGARPAGQLPRRASGRRVPADERTRRAARPAARRRHRRPRDRHPPVPDRPGGHPPRRPRWCGRSAIGTEPLRLALPAGHPLAAPRSAGSMRRPSRRRQVQASGSPTSPASRSSPCGRRRRCASWATTCAQRRASGLRVVFEGDDLSNLRGLVAAALGVAIVPAPRGSPVAGRTAVRYLAILDDGAERDIYLTWSAERPLLPAAELFRRHVDRHGRPGRVRPVTSDRVAALDTLLESRFSTASGSNRVDQHHDSRTDKAARLLAVGHAPRSPRALLDAAREVFADGFADASIAEVVRRGQVRRRQPLPPLRRQERAVLRAVAGAPGGARPGRERRASPRRGGRAIDRPVRAVLARRAGLPRRQLGAQGPGDAVPQRRQPARLRGHARGGSGPEWLVQNDIAAAPV